MAIWLGLAAAAAGLLLLLQTIVAKFLHPGQPPGFTSLAVLILFFGGTQLVVVGILGVYIGRIFDEVKRRPNYVVMDRSGWAAEPEPRPPQPE